MRRNKYGLNECYLCKYYSKVRMKKNGKVQKGHFCFEINHYSYSIINPENGCSIGEKGKFDNNEIPDASFCKRSIIISYNKITMFMKIIWIRLKKICEKINF